MLVRIKIRPGGEVTVMAEGTDATPGEGSAAIIRTLRLLTERGRIPFSEIGDIENHRAHGITDGQKQGQARTEQEKA